MRLALVALLLAGCVTSLPPAAPSPSATEAPTAIPAPSVTGSPEVSEPAATPAPTASPSATATAVPTIAAKATPTLALVTPSPTAPPTPPATPRPTTTPQPTPAPPAAGDIAFGTGEKHAQLTGVRSTFRPGQRIHFAAYFAEAAGTSKVTVTLFRGSADRIVFSQEVTVGVEWTGLLTSMSPQRAGSYHLQVSREGTLLAEGRFRVQ